MKLLNIKYQNGIALLIFVMVLMGVGGFVLAGYGQGVLKRVDVKKFEHNTRVLKEAKQALLQFAYNYPLFNAVGPGRLPCPDHDNDGDIDFPLDCDTVGRFPWKDYRLNFYDARDADGERLWYAVSESFDNDGGGGGPINSATVGSITLIDQSENVIYDGVGAGIAAVIIAPGPVVGGQDRVADPYNPANFLDSHNGFDNSVFTNGESDTNDDGFILGPVFDQAQNIIVINDQIIVITAAEVIEMAEKATLQAYRTALLAYDQRIDNDIAAGDHYPWLFNFAVNNYGGGYPELDDYPSNTIFGNERVLSLGSNGRIPSIFTNYFTETNGQAIESHLGVNLTLVYPISPSTVGFNQAFSVCPSNPAINCTTGSLDFDVANNHVINQTSTNPLTGVTFQDTDPNVFSVNDGRLTATMATNDTFTDVRYFWDEKPVGDGWTECIFSVGDEKDCNRNSAGINVPGFLPNLASQVLRVQIDVNLTGVINFDMDYGTIPVVAVVNLADGTQHANISGTFAGANLDDTTMPVTVSYIYDDNYNIAFNNQANGNLSLADLLQTGSLALTLRYYPELPDWAFNDGWHDSIQMAYANNLRPNIAGACIEADPLPANRCLTVNNLAGNIDTKKSILIIAGQRNWNDVGAPGLADDIGGVFDLENANLDNIFDVRVAGGNDKILVIDEL